MYKSQSCYRKPRKYIQRFYKYNFCHKRLPDTEYCNDFKTESDCGLHDKWVGDQSRVDIRFGLEILV